jgi:putative N6-adenine-specific DNA methylase
MIKKDRADNCKATKRVRRHVTGRVREYYAVTVPGFEDVCRQELIGLGMDAGDLSMDAGGVTFSGRFVDCQRANLHLRTATRILMRIGTFTATNPRQVMRHCSAIPWELFLPAGPLPDINVSSRRSRLYHTGLVADSVRQGLIARLGERADSLKLDFSQTLFVRLVDDRVTLSLDSSGEPLYKRGLKAGPAQAPLRETLAAGILLAAGYDGRQPLLDPMCGSGTFSLEAAMMAKQMVPGGRRTFAFMGWPAFSHAQWRYLKREVQTGEATLNQPLVFASDIDVHACERLADRIAANDLSDAVRVTHKDFFTCKAALYGSRPGIVAINPPYGLRLGTTRAAEALFGRICRHLKDAFPGWKVALIAPKKSFIKVIPFPVRRMAIMHGGLSVTLCLAENGT